MFLEEGACPCARLHLCSSNLDVGLMCRSRPGGAWWQLLCSFGAVAMVTALQMCLAINWVLMRRCCSASAARAFRTGREELAFLRGGPGQPAADGDL